MHSKEIHLGPDPVVGKRQVRHSDKSPKTMIDKKTDDKFTPVKDGAPKVKPDIRKPVIAFYKNTEKSRWVLFPQICHNEKIAKLRIHTQTGSEKVKCIDVPEELQNV